MSDGRPRRNSRSKAVKAVCSRVESRASRRAQRDLRAIKDRVVTLKPGDDIVTGL
jgi:hypothetical protein